MSVLMYSCSLTRGYANLSNSLVESRHSVINCVVTHVRGKHNLKELLLNMPKEQQQEVLLKSRLKIKEKSQKYVPGTVTLQVLGSGARGAPRSLYVFTDQSRYIFNCGEGTQRLAHEHKMKLSKLQQIFITQSSWCNIGGLPGVALTIQDVGVPEITLHGPPGLDEIFAATQRFVKLKDLKVYMADCNQNSHFEDAVFSVNYVPVVSKTVPNQVIDTKCNVQEMEDHNEASDTNNSVGIRSAEKNSSNVDNITNGKLCSVKNDSDCDSDDVDYYEHERVQKRKRQVTNDNDIKRRKLDPKSLPPKTMNIAMSYICKLKDRPGTLSLERCVDFKVPAGPLLGKLKAGHDVTLADGTLVRSADVRDPDEPGPLFIVVDCPSQDYIPSLVENPVFKKHQATAEKDSERARLVVHFTPPSVMSHPKYYEWMEQFAISTQHLSMNESNRCMGSIAVHRAQYLLNSLARDSGIFPSLKDNSIKITAKNEDDSSKLSSQIQTTPHISPAKQLLKEDDINETTIKLSPFYERREDCREGEPNIFVLPHKEASASKGSLSSASEVDKSKSPFPIMSGSTLVKFHLRPNKGFDWRDEVQLHPNEYDKEVSGEQYEESRRQLREYFASKRKSPNGCAVYPRVTFLGTGSCIPNKTRNTSGILLKISDESYMILDCGEGTYGQMVRLKGWYQTDVILKNLTAIFVSHLHADHHIGLIALLQARRKAIEASLEPTKHAEKLLLLAPVQIVSWLRFYHNRFEPILQEIELVPNGKLDVAQRSIEPNLENLMLSRTGLVDISTCLVAHCPNAYGLSLQHTDWKVTYSGDTMPCETLEKLGANSTLLIHEATMEDELEWEARVKMHSTTSQAIEMGKRMKAQHVILTHFSQRYAKVPRLGSFGVQDNVGIAFDNMEVGLDDLPDLPVMIPALKVIFADHHDELEQKAFRRQMRKQREAQQLKV